MLKNNFKTALRQISRHKIYASIHVLGLALGICACFLIYLITRYEFSFDRFHPENDRIYRITGEVQSPAGEKIFLNSPVSDVAGFQSAISGFQAKAGFHLYDAKVSIKEGNALVKNFNIRGEIIIAEPGYFDVFNYRWLEGNASTAIRDPNKVVLTETKARKYFGSAPPASNDWQDRYL